MKTFKLTTGLGLIVLILGLLSACGDLAMSPGIDDTVTPSVSPSVSPSASPSVSPSVTPGTSPSVSPGISPSVSPSISASPSVSPSVSTSPGPSISPSVSSSTAGKKVTICHATGSDSNPYVEITISENALAGHNADRGDIVPAPAGGCPAVRANPSVSPGSSPSVSPGTSPSISPSVSPGITPSIGSQAAARKVSICHATGSASNPYVEITVSENAVAQHSTDKGDIIPAPSGGCPKATKNATGKQPTPVSTPTPKPVNTKGSDNGNNGGNNGNGNGSNGGNGNGNGNHGGSSKGGGNGK